MSEHEIQRQKILDHGHMMMDAIKAKHGEGDKFFAAMAVMTENLERHEKSRTAQVNI